MDRRQRYPLDHGCMGRRPAINTLRDLLIMANPEFSAEDIAAMRAWIADCYWPDLDDTDTLTDAQVIRGVARHYTGGLTAFLADAQ